MSEIKINKTLLIVLLGILAALGPFTIDMYLPGFSKIAEDLGTNENQVAFTLTSYFVGIAFGQLIYGPIVDKYGRKKPLLAGLTIYSIAALGCALSPDIESMIAMRFLQALGGCVGMVASNAIISDVYQKEHRAKAFSSIMLVMGVAPLIAPSVGSFFVEKAEWTYIFYFLAIFSVFVSVLILVFLPETSKYMHSEKLKASKITSDYLSILKNRTFLLYTLSGSISNSILFAYISSASFVFLTYYGLDKAIFSVLFAVNASGLILGSYANGLLTQKINYLKMARVASLFLSIASIVILILVLLNPQIPYYYAVAGVLFILTALGFINPNATAASMSPFTGNAGAAAALGGAIRMGAGALVAGIIGAFHAETSRTMFVIIFVLSLLSAFLLQIAKKTNQQQTT